MLVVTLALACFVLGWLAARSCGEQRHPAGPATATAGPTLQSAQLTPDPNDSSSHQPPAARDVRIIVDAGSLQLMPDASLRLEKIRPPFEDGRSSEHE